MPTPIEPLPVPAVATPESNVQPLGAAGGAFPRLPERGLNERTANKVLPAEHPEIVIKVLGHAAPLPPPSVEDTRLLLGLNMII